MKGQRKKGCLGARTAGWMDEKTNVDVGRKLMGWRVDCCGI